MDGISKKNVIKYTHKNRGESFVKSIIGKCIRIHLKLTSLVPFAKLYSFFDFKMFNVTCFMLFTMQTSDLYNVRFLQKRLTRYSSVHCNRLLGFVGFLQESWERSQRKLSGLVQGKWRLQDKGLWTNVYVMF